MDDAGVMRTGLALALALALLVLIADGPVCAQAPDRQPEWSGYLSMEPRVFLDRPASPEQPGRGLSWSAVLAPELRYSLGEGRGRIAIEPFLRFDQHDHKRRHADLREASWLRVDGPWALRAGLSRVFWGVTESRHLVDIVNQTDLVEDLDGEAKLGQPMVHVERWTERGTFGVFLLPGFRERTFPADDARLRAPLPISSGRAQYESGARDGRVDLALRWSQVLGPWDIGLSAFQGNSREPRFIATPAGADGLVLIPRYDVITQFGADVQHTGDAWAWKLESIVRRGHDGSFAAAVGGFEYTFYGVAGGAIDVGVLAEALYDGRGPEAPPAVLGDGWFAGMRIALNDPDGTAILAGVLVERGGGGIFSVIDAERRIGERWKLELEGRFFSRIDTAEPFLHALHKDSFLTVRLARYF
jgi:hypothetical protein